MVHEHLPQRAGKNLRRSIGRVDVSHLEQSRTPVLYVCGRAHPNVLAVNMRATHRFFVGPEWCSLSACPRKVCLLQVRSCCFQGYQKKKRKHVSARMIKIDNVASHLLYGDSAQEIATHSILVMVLLIVSIAAKSAPDAPSLLP